MKRVMLVGSSPTNTTTSILQRLAQQGNDYLVLEDQRAVPKGQERDPAHWLPCDFSSREKVHEAISRISVPIDAVMTLYENYVLPCAWINERLGLQGMSEASALACTDKFLMRQAFARSGHAISPDFVLADNEAAVRTFAAGHEFPLILKPANLVKSLLVTKNDSLDELLNNYRRTSAIIGDVYAQYAPNRQPAIILEEFLQGSMHSVAGFADHEGNPHIVEPIIDLELARDAGYDDTFLYSRTLPSQLQSSQQETLRQCAKQGIEALGMQSTPAHIEIILTKRGPKIVEIGARLGGYRDRMYRLGAGIDLLGAAISIASGDQPSLARQKHEQCAVFELFPEKPGNFVGITGESVLKSLPSCVYFDIKPRVGSYVGKASAGHKRCAVIILHNADAMQFAKDVEAVKQSVKVDTV